MTATDIEHAQPGTRPLSRILDEIAAEALHSGDQPILDLAGEASDLLEPGIEPSDPRRLAQDATLLELLATLLATRRRHPAPASADADHALIAQTELRARLREPEVDLDGALDMLLARLEERIDPAPGVNDPAWESTIVVWSQFDPEDVELDTLAREACNGDAICTYQHTRRCSVALAPDAARSFFAVDQDDGGCEGCGARDIASCPCLVCESCGSPFAGADQQARDAGWTVQRDTPGHGAPHGALRRVECNGNGCRASTTCLTVRQRKSVTLAPITAQERARTAAWFNDQDTQQWAGGSALLETWLAPGAPSSDVFLASSDSEPVAVIGAEPAVGETVLAIVVNPARRGEGIGTSTLEALAELERYRASQLTCEIASDNVAARLAAAHAGFREDEPDDDGYITFARVPGEADR